MIRRLIASIIIFTAFLSINVYADEYSGSTDIKNTGSHKYKAVRLTPEIYNNIRPDMADLGIYDSQNTAVPYLINSFNESDTETKKSYNMKLVNSFVKDDYFYYDYALVSAVQEDVTSTSIEVLSNNTNFAKKVELYGGYDNVNWEKVQDDVIYNVDGNKKLEIAFSNVKKYTFYRFKIPNNLEKVSFSSVMLKYNKTLQKREYFVESITPGYTVEERGSSTVLKIQGLKNLKLSSITLKTDSIFKRNVTFDSSVSKMLYNLIFTNTSYRDLTISLDGRKTKTDIGEIVIDNKDDKPIGITGIEVKYLADELIFDGSSSNEYRLKFGDSKANTPKSYDIVNYRQLILNEGYDTLNMGEITSRPVEVPVKPEHDYKLIFNIVISLVAVSMGVIVLMKLKK